MWVQALKAQQLASKLASRKTHFGIKSVKHTHRGTNPGSQQEEVLNKQQSQSSSYATNDGAAAAKCFHDLCIYLSLYRYTCDDKRVRARRTPRGGTPISCPESYHQSQITCKILRQLWLMFRILRDPQNSKTWELEGILYTKVM